MKKVLFLAALVILGLDLVRKTSAAVPLGTRILFEGVRLSAGKVIADFTAQNLSEVSSTIQSMTGRLLVNGNDLGPLTDFATVSVPPGSLNSTFTCTVPVSILNGIVDIADMIAGNSGSPVVFRVTGFAAIDQRAVPLDLVYQVV